MKIAIALSGGGVRASAFHAGVLQRLAADGLLEQFTFLSTVSGGSLIAGLVFCSNDLRWPDSRAYLSNVLPYIRRRLTSGSVQYSYAWRALVLPTRLLHGRAHILADQLSSQWGIQGTIDELPHEPRWFINSTCYETGKNWRFSKLRMGDYRTNYVVAPVFPIAEAIASSAAVPGLIGPLVIRSKEFEWSRYEGDQLVPAGPAASRFELWDGGVYDNLGTESLFKPAGGCREGIDFLIVSDASAALDFSPRSLKRALKPGHRALRLVDIATDQVRGLRARTLVAEFARGRVAGTYLRMGNTSAEIYSAAGLHAPAGDYLTKSAAQQAATFPTMLRQLSNDEFELLCRHGYEVADATLASRQPNHFTNIPRSIRAPDG